MQYDVVVGGFFEADLLASGLSRGFACFEIEINSTGVETGF